MDRAQLDKYNQRQDIWFGGQHITGPNGGACYFICEHFDKTHLLGKPDPVTGKEYTTWCKYRDEYEDGSHCNMECSQFGRCETCSGFSAVRCSDCDVISYD